MSNKVYSHSVLTFVPHFARPDLVSLGIIVIGHGESALRLIDDLSVAESIDDKGVLPSTVEEAESLKNRLHLTEAWLKSRHYENRNVLRYTFPLPVLASSANEALEMMWSTFYGPEQ